MLTKRMQVQAIADLAAGLNRPTLRANDFDEPWQSAYRALCDNGHRPGPETLREAFAKQPDLLGQVLAAVPGAGLGHFPSLAEMDLPPVRWMWQGWIPRGMITLLGAVPGAGKSYLALDLSKRVIGGERWPDGAAMPADIGRSVVYVDAESIPQVIKERAEGWDMDLSRFFVMLPTRKAPVDFGNEMWQDRLVEMMHATGAGLLVVDSMSSIQTRGENNVEDVRQVLGFLNGVAQDFDCGLLLIHHLKKHSLQLPLLKDLTIDDFRGSSHIIAMSRSVLGLSVIQTGPEVDRNGPRKLDVVKTNLAQYPQPLGCEFVPLHPSGVLLKWLKDAPKEYQEPTKGDECADWLIQFLTESGEPVRPADVVTAAEEAGYNRRMVFRAREALEGRVVNTAGRKHPDNCWKLAGQPDVAGMLDTSADEDEE